VEGRGLGLYFSWHCLAELWKTQKASGGAVPAKIQTGDLLNTGHKHYHLINCISYIESFGKM